MMRRRVPRAVGCRVVAAYVRLLRLTGRWHVEGEAIPRGLVARGQPFLVAFWHGRMLMVSQGWRFAAPFKMVISQHPDGRLIASTIAHLGFAALTGSTNRGGSEVLRAMITALRGGQCVGVTPDGPRGPRMRVSAGVVHAARLAGVPVVPVTSAAAPCRVLDSWDKFILPSPFGRGIIRWGEPLTIARDAGDETVEAVRRALEETLNQMTRDAEQSLGLAPVPPAAPELAEA
jgi:lysophospholipid acyltransferase (LPLAT)-like uncharacterized protein